MAETPSNMLPLNTVAPNFSLLDTKDDTFKSLQQLQSSVATVIMFICNHCPYVKYIEEKLVEIAHIYSSKGIHFIAISANDAEIYPQDGPDAMKMIAEEKRYPFPYLYDATQAVAKAYHAACTPDFYVFDGELKCVYRGRFDNATPNNRMPVTGDDLCYALDAILCNETISASQYPSLGCNIKWKTT